MRSPYSGLPKRAFWRSGVSERLPSDLGEFYQPRFKITPAMKVATAGSCFAQHVGRTLRGAGFNVIDAEPAPPKVPQAIAQKYGFGLYSARYGNIYTARQLLQLVREARGRVQPALPVWQRDGRFFDAQRPGLEPLGFDTATDVMAHRVRHLVAVRQAFGTADVIVFTFGLTEAWQHLKTETVYPTAPGTIAGDFDPAVFGFRNFTHAEVLADFTQFRAVMMRRNQHIKFVVTVSPVPPTATASGQHVEVATSYSKSVLRAVCGELVQSFDNVDYFPSYELITSQKNAAGFYNETLREVTTEGVATAMSVFLAAHLGTEAAGKATARGETRQAPGTVPQQTGDEGDADLVCEDALLEAFLR